MAEKEIIPGYGLVGEVYQFYNAFAPKQRAWESSKYAVPLADTVLYRNGRAIKWIKYPGHSIDGQDIVLETVAKSFQRRVPETLECFRIVRHIDNSIKVLEEKEIFGYITGPGRTRVSDVAAQVYQLKKRDAPPLFQQVYDFPLGAKAPSLVTIQCGEKVPNSKPPKAGSTYSRFKLISSSLDECTRRAVVHLEGALNAKISYLVLDYIIDDSDQPIILWPSEFRYIDKASLEDAQPDPAAQTNESPKKKEQSKEVAPSKDGKNPSWVQDKVNAFNQAQEIDEEFQREYDQIVQYGGAVGSGLRGSILIVDADVNNVIVAVRELTKADYAVTVVPFSEAPALVARVGTGSYDCILMSRDLHVSSGPELTEIIRRAEQSHNVIQRRPGATGTVSHIPILAFTDSIDGESMQLYLHSGMDGCISKPVDVNALLNTVSRAIPVPVNRSNDPALFPHIAAAFAQQQHQYAMQGNPMQSPGSPMEIIQFGQTPASQNGSLFSGTGNGMGVTYSSEDQLMQARETGVRGARTMAQSRKQGVPASQSQNLATQVYGTPAPAPGMNSFRSTSPRRGATGNSLEGTGIISSLPDSSTLTTIQPPDAPPRQQGTVLADEDGSRLGLFQLDAETAIPFCVMGQKNPGVPLFHFVVVSDIFDTYEQYQILFRRIVAKFPGLRVLLFNQPGQAFTEFRQDVVLNNEYHAGVLHALLNYLGPRGIGEFDLDGGVAAFHLLGVGTGGAIANYFACAYGQAYPNMRSLVQVNGFAHVDAHLAGVMHDCMNVFACSPPTRPDLPLYFFARFLFSPQYLQKIGAPLALNLYTAVSNPISLAGRVALCQGVLNNVDTRQALGQLNLPMVAVASASDGLVKPSHIAALVDARGGEVRSIKRALQQRAGACVVWLKGGHEAFQESKQPLINLLEQLAVGFHEVNDVAFVPLEGGTDPTPSGPVKGLAGRLQQATKRRATDLATEAARLRGESGAGFGQFGSGQVAPNDSVPRHFEDKFFDTVLASRPRPPPEQLNGKYPELEDIPAHARTGGISATASDVKMSDYSVSSLDPLTLQMEVPEAVANHKPKGRRASTTNNPTGTTAKHQRKLTAKELEQQLLLDPTSAAFATRDQTMGRPRPAGQVKTPKAQEDLKEYMTWRVRRNKQRLLRISACATTIQKAWRSYLARTLVVRIQHQRAALDVQRWWRGCLARQEAREVRKQVWAARVIQRSWRGLKGRSVMHRMKAERRAALIIQRSFRGYRSRRFVALIKQQRRQAALIIQAAWRRVLATRAAWLMRDMRNAATNIQRVWRGCLGRARAAREREKYLFSKSQAQAIEFGRQMLVEHKLYGTKLQSEVSILTKEKLATEEKVEAVLAEIAAFEQGVRALESELLHLSRAEAEAVGALDEEAKLELHESKVRLDRDFASMLVKIADRREMLSALERKLQIVDRSRLAKKEELKDLERKLVVLLDQQQQELGAIRMRQERRSELVVEDAVHLVEETLRAGGNSTSSQLLLGDGTLTATGTLGVGDGQMVSANGSNGQIVGVNGGGSRILKPLNGSLASQQEKSVPAAANGYGPTPQQRAEAQALMSSTETMMKFGFMSMSLTYFSSLNMVRAMRQMGTANTMLASNPMLALIGQMGGAAAAGGNPAEVALAATGALSLTPSTTPSTSLSGDLALAQTSAAGALALANSIPGTGAAYRPNPRPAQLMGEEALDPQLWTVADVSNWLVSLSLGQYQDAFADAAVDGPFLCELQDDDLRSTLGIEHALHRKKILSSISRLRQAVGVNQMNMSGAAATTGRLGTAGPGSVMSMNRPGSVLAQNRLLSAGGRVPNSSVGGAPTQQTLAAEALALSSATARSAASLKLEDLMSWVRHNKGKLLADALNPLPDGSFDRSTIRTPYTQHVGTQYIEAVEQLPFHINKPDDKGNSLLLVAAQNGRLKLAQILVAKGANVNHQNALGNTALHYAMAYKFHELAAWLADPERGGANDEIVNMHGMGPYDGLQPE